MRKLIANPRWAVVTALLVLIVIVIFLSLPERRTPPGNRQNSEPPPDSGPVFIGLPEPRFDSDMSIEKGLLQRRSIRSFAEESLTLQELAQMMWAAQGVTDIRGLRTAPSAGATYPLELYAVTGEVDELGPGVYRYDPDEHRLLKTMEGDRRAQLADAALGQRFVEEAAVVFVLTAVYERTTIRYGDRGVRYVHMEAGHAAQNVYLQATSMGLATVVVGAFVDERVAEILGLPENEQPLYIMPVGRRA